MAALQKGTIHFKKKTSVDNADVGWVRVYVGDNGEIFHIDENGTNEQLANLSEVVSISGDLQSQIDSIVVPTSATFLSDYDTRFVNISGDTMTGELVVNTTGVEPNIDFYDARDSISVYDNANSLIGIYASADLPRNAIFSGFRSRGTIDSPTAVQNGDTLLEIGGHGWNGTEIIYDGVYKIKVDGLVTTTSVPIEYTWSTDEYTEMMRLRNSGTLQLLANVPATNTTTGTLQVAGGGSFTGAVWVGTTLNNIQDCNLASDSSDRKVYVGAGNTSSGIIVGQSTVPSYNPSNINYPDAAPTIFRITTTMNNSTGGAGRGSYFGYTNHTGNDENQPTYGGVFFANRTGSNVPTSDGNFAVGIHAAANRAGSTLTGDAIAVNAYARAVSTNAGTGEAIAVRGIAVATSTNVAQAIGVYGEATGAAQNYAGQFVGDVEVSNNVTILSLSGNTNQIVTLDANGKLLASGSTVPTSATFLTEYDARFVNITGDTMTGNLIITSDNSSPALQINSDGDARIRLNNPNGGDIYSELAFATDGADVIGLYLGTDGYFSIYDYNNNVDRFRFGPAITEIKAQDDTSILYGEGDEGYIIINSDRGNTNTYISTSNVERALIVNSSIDAINENVRVGITNDASISGSGAFQVDGGASITKNLVVGGIAGTSGNIVTHDANGKLLDSGVSITSISTKTIGFIIDGSTSVPVSGAYASVVAPFSGTITNWTIVADVSGSATLDIWKANGAKPTNANSITASAKPTITSSDFATSSTLTGWTTSIATGDVLTVELETIDIIKRITIQLEVTI